MSNVMMFKKNKIDSSATFAFTSASTALASYLYDNQINPKLLSAGSTDIIDEVMTITFLTPQTMSAIHLANHNFKSFTIQYTTGAGYVDFSTPISETVNAVSSNFYQFNAVVPTDVKITVHTTQDINAEKFIGDLKCLEGYTMSALSPTYQLSKNPVKATFDYQEASKNYYASGKENLFVLFGATMKIKAKFEALNTVDMAGLYDRKFGGIPFFVFFNGGDATKTELGWRVQDIFYVNMTDDFAPRTRAEILGLGTDIDLIFESTHSAV